MKNKKLGKVLDSGLDYFAVRIAQTAEKQGIPVWLMYVGRTDCPQWDRLVTDVGDWIVECSSGDELLERVRQASRPA